MSTDKDLEQTLVKTTTTKPKSRQIIYSPNKPSTYSIEDTCPCCGRYTPDGDICITCLKEHDLYKPKVTYVEF